jgi:hypothetical protein
MRRRVEAEARQAVRTGGGRASESWCGRRAVGAQVGSGGGEHAGRGGVDLSRVRERGVGVHDIFLDKVITSVGHP